MGLSEGRTRAHSLTRAQSFRSSPTLNRRSTNAQVPRYLLAPSAHVASQHPLSVGRAPAHSGRSHVRPHITSAVELIQAATIDLADEAALAPFRNETWCASHACRGLCAPR
jgi:hypothetical protein